MRSRELIVHYFQLGEDGLPPALTARVKAAIVGNEPKGALPLALTPAQVEQLAAEHDEVEDIVAALEAMALGGAAAIGASAGDGDGGGGGAGSEETTTKAQRC